MTRASCHIFLGTLLLSSCLAVVTEWEEKFLAVPDAKRVRMHHENITALPHIAGTLEQKRVAEYVRDMWLEAGIPHVELQVFNATLTYPISRRVEIVFPPEEAFNATLQEDVIPEDPSSNVPGVVPTFNGYATSGTAEGPLVYVNYGEMEDFDRLRKQNISTRGAVCVARYGRVFRGLKAQLADDNGCVGLIVYSDPQQDGFVQGETYPEGPWRPESGAQRGSMLFLSTCPGDPARLPKCWGNDGPMEGNVIPAIPVQPMGYGDAAEFLRRMDGPTAESIGGTSWVGGLNISYRVGPSSVRVLLDSQNSFEQRELYNVIGTIPGSDLPDEVVMAGNHLDAWTFGAVDPSSGTASLIETAQGLGALIAEGWKPRRTIQLAGWDGEEYGLVGSTHFGESTNFKASSMVAYFNLDSSVGGPNFSAGGVPSLGSLVRGAAADVLYPQSNRSILDTWSGNLGRLGSGSDYTVFLDKLGIPCTDMGFGGISGGIYHSTYDSHYWMKKFGDPEFLFMTAAAKVMGLMLMRTADSFVLPLDYPAYAEQLNVYLAETGSLATENNVEVELSALRTSIRRFQEASLTLPEEADVSDDNVAMVNALLMAGERAFLHPGGLPRRPFFKHLVVAPGLRTGYAADVFPGVKQAIREGNIAEANSQAALLAARIEAASAAIMYQPADDSADGKGPHWGYIVLIVGGVTLLSIAVIGVAIFFRRRSYPPQVDGAPLLSSKGKAVYSA